MVYYNPLDKFYKSQIGAVSAEKEITFRVKGDFNSVVFVLNKDGENSSTYHLMVKNRDYFECSIKFERGLYFYYFYLDDNKYLSLSSEHVGVITDKPNPFQLTVYDKDYVVPTWLKGGVIYQIFPDRFFIGDKNKRIPSGRVMHENTLDTPIYKPNDKGQVLNNDFFGGDIKGIISKLDYIKSLGVTAIYLNPIFKAYSNHRYDTGDYMQIDPLLGTKDDFVELIQKATTLDIKIILDGVFNHTGDDSLYFNKYGNYDSIGAYQSKDSKYYDWFNFEHYPDKYESWWGIKTLPSVNENSQSYFDFITGENGVIDYYTKLGIGGWRLDVVDELPSAFVRKIRTAVKRVNSNAIVIGEVWEDASNKISYGKRREYFQGYELDSVMNYPLKESIIDFVRNKNVKNLSSVIKEQHDHYPVDVVNSLMNILSTHDTYRLITAVAGKSMDGKSKDEMSITSIPREQLSVAKDKLKIATLLQYTLYGVPSLYYGDEIGMEGYSDPLNRKFYVWDNQDEELLEWFRFLGRLRSEFSVFADGEIEQIYASNGAFVFVRKNNDCEIAVAVNVSDKDFYLNFDGTLFDLIKKESFKNQFVLQSLDMKILINKS